jgi:hypothetical protein
VLAGALNTDANLPLFIRQYQPTFPVGMASQMGAVQYMQINPMVRTFVPYVAFIDRKGIIRTQFTGGELADATLEKVLHDVAENLVNEAEAPAKPKAKRSSH